MMTKKHRATTTTVLVAIIHFDCISVQQIRTFQQPSFSPSLFTFFTIAMVVFKEKFLTVFTVLSFVKCGLGFVSPTSVKAIAKTRLSSSTLPAEESESIVIVGGGWGGLSAAYALYKHNVNGQKKNYSITLVESSPRVGGLVRDGFTSMNGLFKAEAGQHGFWDNYHNIFQLLEELPNVDMDDVLTGYAEQGQYSPKGLEAVWPVYRNINPSLPTGLAQALYTRFNNLSIVDLATALPLVLAFSEFDDSFEAWERYDNISFRDLCIKLGVSKRCYNEAFEPMILTGLFAPGSECSAAAALGMAYFFVLKSQNSFDVRWCKGNIGEKIFQPWVDIMSKTVDGQEDTGVKFLTSTRVVGFNGSNGSNTNISEVICESLGEEKKVILKADKVLFAVGGAALNKIVTSSPMLSTHKEFRRFANLRGTGVLATRLYLDKKVETPYSANACWGFDEGVGMTYFDITKLHDIKNEEFQGSILEVDYYHAASLIVMSDNDIVKKVKEDIATILGKSAIEANVLDAAIVRLPSAVNWYSPGSYKNMPDLQSEAIPNTFFVGDLVRSRHGSWSQEKAFVTGIEAANKIIGNESNKGVIPLSQDEVHVAAGRKAVELAKSIITQGNPARAPSLVDFLW
jgi:uncharacterized protein with NAD-binding domain and iron-sulfur cluster